MICIISFGLVLLFIWRQVKSNKIYATYNHKYDPRILDRVKDSELDMMSVSYKTNNSNSLKKLAIDNDLFEEENTMNFLNNYLKD